MIDTVIQCSKCEELTSVIARSISFPFVCDGCTGGDTQMLHKFQEEEQEPYFDHAAEAEETVGANDIDHEGATIEATTLLIEDLESQIKASHDREEGLIDDNIALVDDIRDLGNQLEFAAGLNAFTALHVLALTAELDESHAWEDISHETIGKLLNERDELSRSLKLTNQLATNLRFQRDGLNVELAKAQRSPWRKFIDYMSKNPYEGLLDSEARAVANSNVNDVNTWSDS